MLHQKDYTGGRHYSILNRLDIFILLHSTKSMQFKTQRNLHNQASLPLRPSTRTLPFLSYYTHSLSKGPFRICLRPCVGLYQADVDPLLILYVCRIMLNNSILPRRYNHI